MKRLDRTTTMWLALMAFTASVTAAPRCAAQTVIGNWESSMSEGWFDWNCCTGTEFLTLQPPRFDFNSTGATLGTTAVQFNIDTPATYTQWLAIKLQNVPYGPPDWGNGIDEWRDDFLANSKLAFDLTLVQSEMSSDPGHNFATLNPIINAQGFGFHAITEHLESISNNDDGFMRGNNFDPTLLVGTRTFTITYDISFTHDEAGGPGGAGVDNMEIAADPFYIELLFESFTNGPVVYHIDNVRLFTPDTGAVPGDYNNNGTVDAADYVVWRENVGQATITNRGPDIMGDIGTADYDFWASRFGATSGSGSSLGQGAGVPEPATWLFAIMTAVGALAAARTR